MFKPLRALARDLANGSVTAVALVETALARIQDPAGEGGRAFIALDGAAGLDQATFYDRQRKAGRAVPAYAGIPIGVKDLFDLKGQVTRAGSAILATAAPAESDAPAIAASQGSGLHRCGSQQHDRIRLFGRRTQSALRHAALALRPADRAHPRRLVRGRRRRRRRRHGAARDRQRYRRLLPNTGRLQWRCRLQILDRTYPDQRRLSPVARRSTALGRSPRPSIAARSRMRSWQATGTAMSRRRVTRCASPCRATTSPARSTRRSPRL